MAKFKIMNKIQYEAAKQAVYEYEQNIIGSCQTWQEIALKGYKIQAIMKYRKENNKPLEECKDEVESFLAQQVK